MILSITDAKSIRIMLIQCIFFISRSYKPLINASLNLVKVNTKLAYKRRNEKLKSDEPRYGLEATKRENEKYPTT